ncbi:Thioredoxin-like protein 1 [Ophidiomyces ophidiicola]|nr:Thioredoxin-like protein 1 [Ophidiomyces ophidiicola]
MSKPVVVNSSEEFSRLLTSSKVVVADCKLYLHPAPYHPQRPRHAPRSTLIFALVKNPQRQRPLRCLSANDFLLRIVYATWCGPCTIIAPVFEELAAPFSWPDVTFVKIDVDKQQDIARAFKVAAMPTFLIFKDGKVVDTVRGADSKGLTSAVKKHTLGLEGGESASGGADSSPGSTWLGAAVPRGYQDITAAVEVKGIDLLNCNNDVAPGRTLFDASQPSALTPKAKSDAKPDWVESDTDEQLMLFMPFKASLKVHSIQITSIIPPKVEDEEMPVRPKTLKLYVNPSHIINFDEADDTEPTQQAVIAPSDWDAKTGTAKVELRFVKFQRVTSLVVYFVDGDGDAEKIRVDRIRLFGETGEQLEMGKLVKFGEGAE